MERRRSRLEVWLPGGYLVLVLAVQLWVEVVSRTGDGALAGVWSLLLTAPFSLVVVWLSAPGRGPPVPQPEGLVHTGAEPPTPLPAPLSSELPSELPSAPVDGVLDPSAFEALGATMWWGYYGALVVGALVNAVALWALVRVLAGRRRTGGGVEGGWSA
ncbi:SCO4225 family membrane protein [Streptomyces sp. H34-S4]|uniref:SCO4225 family membrane protein n=1 Tax=Streptomyces sp. H34-S4 TaxID=2996463 RepID=UPI00226DD89F|nr:hypothetical protein [Streptomyces sp. H34-S4]MCY0935314.1 hypothetical protein [Streptomyces sp. H34-S4]